MVVLLVVVVDALDAINASSFCDEAWCCWFLFVVVCFSFFPLHFLFNNDFEVMCFMCLIQKIKSYVLLLDLIWARVLLIYAFICASLLHTVMLDLIMSFIMCWLLLSKDDSQIVLDVSCIKWKFSILEFAQVHYMNEISYCLAFNMILNRHWPYCHPLIWTCISSVSFSLYIITIHLIFQYYI